MKWGCAWQLSELLLYQVSQLYPALMGKSLFTLLILFSAWKLPETQIFHTYTIFLIQIWSSVDNSHWQNGASSVEVHQGGQGWSTCPGRRLWETRACSAWRSDGFGGNYQKLPSTSWEVSEKMEPGSLLRCVVREQETVFINWNRGGSIWM